ncbi:hypothetical protein JZ751_025191 [Albula glossodonta]|uniref:TLC domain-containing protein n=1 Tax=Albula glossodonta TaxID=121402 RepID=A0A8T2NEH6_9TELE|nr:hypothetical protein JZ751_025191 [Albula glossodonta]
MMEMREWGVVAGSFAGFQLLFSMASPRLSPFLASGFNRVAPHKHTEWNSRWFFEALSYPRSGNLVVANGVAMTVAFFLVRIAVIPTYYLKVAATFGTPAFTRLGLGPQVAWLLSSISLDILNLVWMYKISRGLYKVLSQALGKAKSTQPQKQNHLNSHTD